MPKSAVGIAGILTALLASVHGQPVVARADLLAGFWETTGRSGFDGIFLGINQHIDLRGTDAQTGRQTISIGVYLRNHGGEPAWGWYYAPRGGAEFNGSRLSVAGLTATFDPDAARWTGTWSMGGETKEVLLERPRPAAGANGHPLRGDWNGVPDSLPGTAPTRLHFVQALDGKVLAWMDRTSAYPGARNESFGEWLRVLSADPSNVILEPMNITGPGYRFTGALSDDGNRLTGRWENLIADVITLSNGTVVNSLNTGPFLNALSDFLRIP